MPSRALFAVAVACALAIVPARADADDVDPNRALATDLFDAGVKKMQAGKCDAETAADPVVCLAARDEFRRAVSVYPAGLGALRNLAYVERGLRLVASAARDFREVARRAPLDPDPKRRLWADFARREADTLEPRVPHVTFTFDGAPPDDLAVTLDGAPIPRGAWGAALDLDPGAHEVRAEAKGYAAFKASFTLAEQEKKQVTIALGAKAAAVDVAPTLADAPRSATRVAPLIVIGAGGAAIATGLILGYVAIAKKKSACGDSAFCDPNELSTGHTIADASTIVTAGGAAVLAGGIVWFLLVPRASTTGALRVSPYASPSGGGFAAEGLF